MGKEGERRRFELEREMPAEDRRVFTLVHIGNVADMFLQSPEELTIRIRARNEIEAAAIARRLLIAQAPLLETWENTAFCRLDISMGDQREPHEPNWANPFRIPGEVAARQIKPAS